MSSCPEITARPFEHDRDLHELYAFATATPTFALHLADLPWRLSSPSAQRRDRSQLWHDADGEIVAWVILQHEWATIDFAIRPDLQESALASDVLRWGVGRLEDEAAQANDPMTCYVSAHEHDRNRISLIESAGFTPADWSYLHLGRDLQEPIDSAILPDGYHIRTLAGIPEVGAYVAAHRDAFGSTAMTSEWRRTTLADPRYVADLDLVAVAPDGAIAGFCVTWITPSTNAFASGRIAQVEPFGVSPSHRRRGIGKALLADAMQRARIMGATRLQVDTVSENDASRGTYAAAGFRGLFEARFFARTFTA
ncbi:MAG: GNAT family N-acetyltransferase [Chloroflexia bacterium]|nr:GNAT family N-acetyltransferase [Chloroflexia bacterium]